ncbi:MAG TPA: lamin tail domain-containing protein [Methanothrix sp.]|jgi:hypothetical protein|uniref:lamin tail domain-containing protein n=1 Tax=Methanothrix sp. TaxID=90426 RepID=UPI002CE5E80A|nr:lamin tail domain-containing protein [Methanothrix sp.]MDI9416416.1 lamin tail domain-containing protein [Euryarchaeota archaeon]HON34777.1 lamin tail domain-containing protein [Methanothrix sp.]HRU74634.1 lamin tail domain-containing protein [Methanothrix sp.]
MRPDMSIAAKGGFRVLLLFFCLMALSITGICDVVINEIELSAPNNESMWIELYNTGADPVDLTGWMVKVEDEAWMVTIPLSGIIDPLGFKVAEGKKSWATTGNGTVSLFNAQGETMDRASHLIDHSRNHFTYGRIPDGKRTGTSADWALLRASRGMPNGRELQVG